MKRDSGYSRSPGGDTDTDAGNRERGSGKGARQGPGGDHDDTPDQVGISNVEASVLLTSTERGPAGLDSMGGSESRGRDNYRGKGE